MKKLILSIFLALAVVSFATAEIESEGGLHFCMPFGTRNYKEDNIKYQTTSNAIGFGIDYLTAKEDTIVGAYGDIELLFPQKSKTTITIDDWTGSGTVVRGDFDEWWCLNLFGGPAFNIIRLPVTWLSVTPGVHFSVECQKDGKFTAGTMNFGLGADVQDSFTFFPGTFLSIGCSVYLDLFERYATSASDEKSDTRGIVGISFNPRIGFGVRM